MNFMSDNVVGVAPAVIDWLARANTGSETSYGADSWTKRFEEALCELFERDVAVFLVSTGTAANALSLAAISPMFGAVLCHEESHINTDECAAPELFTGGAKLVPIRGRDVGKIDVASLDYVIGNMGRAPHAARTDQAQPGPHGAGKKKGPNKWKGGAKTFANKKPGKDR